MDDTMSESEMTDMPEQTPAQEPAKAGHNGFDRDEVEPYLRRLHALHDELESESGRIREVIEELYNEAKHALGAPKKALRQVFSEQRARMKREKKWSAEDLFALDELKLSLGLLSETPLGEAALARAAAE